MNLFPERPRVAPGDPAPEFTLPWVERDGSVSLADYRGKGVLLALVRGLWCPFCRRALATLGEVGDGLGEMGVSTLGVVATPPESARLYLRYRPSRVPLAADPAMGIHGVYGLPRPTPTPELMVAVGTVRTDCQGELPEPMPFPEAGAALDRIDGYTRTPLDEADIERGMTQLSGHFLIDRDGIVRWTDLECADEGLSGLGKFPRDDELLEVARALA